MPSRFPPRLFKQIRYYGLACLVALLSVLFACVSVPSFQIAPVKAAQPSTQPLSVVAQSSEQLVKAGMERYQSGQFATAIDLWQQALKQYEQRGDQLNQSAVNSNLALAYQQLGQFPEANQSIQTSLNLLQGKRQKGERDRQQLLAPALNIQGNLQLTQGQAEAAIQTWEQAANLYQQLADQTGYAQSLINQSQAFRALGLYPRARDVLNQVETTLNTQPDSRLKATAFLNLGNVLRLIGELERSSTVLQQSLAIVQPLNLPDDQTAALMSLGNTLQAQATAIQLSSAERAQQLRLEALKHYEQAAAIHAAATTTVQAQLNQLSLLIELNDRSQAEALAQQIRTQVARLPLSRTTIHAQISFAQQLLRLRTLSQDAAIGSLSAKFQESATLLAAAMQQAKTLSDARAESYALGYLGGLYEQTRQWPETKRLTEQALVLAQSSNAADIAYRWQWQLGRVLQAQWEASGKQDQDLRKQAIAAYTDAVDLLGVIRKDLVAINQDVQLSFRESVEPIYRQFVALLLSDQESVSQNNLKKARDVIESLQLAELDNFFQEACLTSRTVEIDQVDRQAAVFYPIILPDRLEVILALPGQPLRHYATGIPQAKLEAQLTLMKRALILRFNRKAQKVIAQKLYDELIRPAEPALATAGIKTLTFVLDGSLRSIPMATLYDGAHYLIENYSLALTPSLQLYPPGLLAKAQLKALVGGLMESRQNFPPLPGVKVEVEDIQQQLPAQVLLNQQFTKAALQSQVQTTAFPIVHLATHGQFSSDAEKTFILSWDGLINARQLSDILRQRQSTQRPIELLVLSACETAQGDSRAALGLAGLALRSGARSTLAALWAVNDRSTTLLMTRFYRELLQPGVTKAEALRRAQLSLLRGEIDIGESLVGGVRVVQGARADNGISDPETAAFSHPYYWAPFVLVGDWL